jgi:hypothetical protein
MRQRILAASVRLLSPVTAIYPGAFFRKIIQFVIMIEILGFFILGFFENKQVI